MQNDLKIIKHTDIYNYNHEVVVSRAPIDNRYTFKVFWRDYPS